MCDFFALTQAVRGTIRSNDLGHRSFIAAHNRAIPLLLLAAPLTSPTYIDQFDSPDLADEAKADKFYGSGK